MWDSDNINDIPTYATMVAYYIDGIYAVNEFTVRNRFPSAILVPISAIGSNAGIVGDCESGDMTISQAINWVAMRRAAGLDPTIYCNQTYGWAPIKQAFAVAGVAQPHYWVANYNNLQVIPAGAVAKQYANSAMVGAHFDVSVVADFWPGVDNVFGPGGGSIGADMTSDEHNMLQQLHDALVPTSPPVASYLTNVLDILNGKVVPALANLGGGAGGLTAAQAGELSSIAADVASIKMRIEKDLAP